MNELALFAGAGGGILGGKLLGWRTVCAVEIDPYAVSVMAARQNDGTFYPFPIWDDIETFDGRPWRGCVDVVSAGFPCQPFSVAGKRAGEDDERNLWPETIRIIREVRPHFCLLENVPGLISSGYFGQVLGDLAACGYDARWDCFSASSIGAPHRRDRLWIVATDSNSERRGAEQVSECRSSHTAKFGNDGAQERMADSMQSRLSDRRSSRIETSQECDSETHAAIERCCGSWWATEPDVGRVAHGVASRVDRLKAIGNGQVPGVVRRAWRELTK